MIDIPLRDVATAFATVTASLVAAFIGSLQGAKTALSRFKQEQGFERRLNCYEEIVKQLGQAKLELEVARTFQEDPGEPPPQKERMWKKVQQEYLGITTVESTALIYASNAVYKNLRAIREAFDAVSDQSNGMDPPDLRASPEVAYELIDKVDAAIARHSAAVRSELGFDALG